MKTIVCFGDSNTFGSHPLGGRHPYEDRWTGRLQGLLGGGYRVIEEGLGGRTTVFEDEIEQGRCGRTALPICLGTHKPFDLLVIMLGTNDLKARFNLPEWDLAHAMRELLRMVKAYPFAPEFPEPQVLVVSPIEIAPGVSKTFGCFAEDAAERSRRFAAIYEPVAMDAGGHFMDAAAFAGPSQEDRLHMDRTGHAALAEALAAKIREILG